MAGPCKVSEHDRFDFLIANRPHSCTIVLNNSNLCACCRCLAVLRRRGARARLRAHLRQPHAGRQAAHHRRPGRQREAVQLPMCAQRGVWIIYPFIGLWQGADAVFLSVSSCRAGGVRQRAGTRKGGREGPIQLRRNVSAAIVERTISPAPLAFLCLTLRVCASAGT